MNKDAGTQANVARFNEIAATWDESPVRTELAQAVGHAILETVVPEGTERALEFGCGTGLVTALLAPRLGHVVAADNSAGMLDILRDKMRQLGLDNIELRRMDVGSEISGGPFNLIFSGMTLHHIGDVAGLLRRLATELVPGGRIAVADLEAEDGSFHGAAEGIMHNGFEPGEVVRWLERAGLEQATVRRIHSIRKTGTDERERDYPVFLATALKPVGAGTE